MTIKEKLYENFKKIWIKNHIDKETLKKTHDDYVIDLETETFEEYIEEFGFANGMLYPCYQEWQDIEFEEATNTLLICNSATGESKIFLVQDTEETDIKNIIMGMSYETIEENIQEISELNIVEIHSEEILNLDILKIIKIDL